MKSKQLLIRLVGVMLLLQQYAVANDYDIVRSFNGTKIGSKITYQGRLSTNILNDFCQKSDNLPYGVWLEVKYDTVSENESILQRTYFLDSLTVTTKTESKNIRGGWNDTYQSIKSSVQGSTYLDLNITFQKNENTISQGESPIKVGNRVFDMTINCYKRTSDNSSSGNSSSGDFGSKNNLLTTKAGGIRIQIISNNNIQFFTKTCTLTNDSKNQAITLNQAHLRDLTNGREVFGGSFPINLDCQGNSGVNTAYISFTDANNTANTTQILSLAQSSSARNVGLKIYDQNDSVNAITYGPTTLPFASTNDSNVKKFGDIQSSTGILPKTYKIYYVKSGNATVSPGSVNAKMIYNLYYK